MIALKGTINGISFYNKSNGHSAREKGSVNKRRIQNNSTFQRTRKMILNLEKLLKVVKFYEM
jgi:hypothetical protein